MLGEVSRLIRLCNEDMTIKKAAKISGVSAALLSEFERGNKNVSLNTLKKLAKAYDMPVSRIFYFEEIKQQLKLDSQNLMIEILRYYLSKQEIFKNEVNENGSKIR